MDLGGSIDTDRDPYIELYEDIDDLIGQQHAVRLNVDAAGRRQRTPKLLTQAAQPASPNDQRLSAVQHNAERSTLAGVKVR